MALLDEITKKLVKLRGPGKDVFPALKPIFAAMDTSKSGELGPAEYKTCLLAIGIRAPEGAILELFQSYRGGAFATKKGGVAYAGFLRAMIEALPPVSTAPESPNSKRRFVSKLVSKSAQAIESAAAAATAEADAVAGADAVAEEETKHSDDSALPPQRLQDLPPLPPAPRVEYRPAFVFRSGALNPLSDDVGSFEADVADLERALQDVCGEIIAAREAVAEAQATKDRSEALGITTARRLGDEIEAKANDITELLADISAYSEEISDLQSKEVLLRKDVAAKEELALKNKARKRDKDAMLAQLEKATKENEFQLADLQAAADALLAELDDTEHKILRSNDHVEILLQPMQPPQSQTLRLGNGGGGIDPARKAAIRERNARAEEQHRINLMQAK
mmetsp:Transcript_49448/g.112230  ORF Transcript_49448/g.112230 Transcript_49448/m.112230 type:complete len:394 (+) Transcript_49448:82-1263(+)